MSKVKYEDIPISFSLKYRQKAIEECDNETPMFCYCGRLATGIHTDSCRRFQSKVQSKLLRMYKESLKSPLEGV